MKKLFLALLVTLCLYISANRLYRFYYENMPVAAPGECLMIQFKNPDFDLNFRIVSNDNEAHKSLIAIPVGNMELGAYAKYSDLRNAHAKKVKCQ